MKDARATVVGSSHVSPTGCKWVLTIVGVCNLMGKSLSNCRKIPSMGEVTYAQHAPGVVLVISEAPYTNVTSVVMQGIPQCRGLQSLIHDSGVAAPPIHR